MPFPFQTPDDGSTVNKKTPGPGAASESQNPFATTDKPQDPNAKDPTADPTKQSKSVGQFESFDACVAAQLSDGKDMLSAHRLCGALMEKTPPADANPKPPTDVQPKPQDQQPKTSSPSDSPTDPGYGDPRVMEAYRSRWVTAALPQGEHKVDGATDKSTQGQVGYADTSTAHVNSLAGKGAILVKHLLDEHGIEDAVDPADATHEAEHAAGQESTDGVAPTATEALFSTGARVINKKFR